MTIVEEGGAKKFVESWSTFVRCKEGLNTFGIARENIRYRRIFLSICNWVSTSKKTKKKQILDRPREKIDPDPTR